MSEIDYLADKIEMTGFKFTKRNSCFAYSILIKLSKKNWVVLKWYGIAFNRKALIFTKLDSNQ